jgi:hypothetical protein
MEPQAVLKQDAGVNAGQHGYMPLRADGEISQLEVARKAFVGLEQFVCNRQF